ncbi:MAG: hypothetical protein ACT4OF_08040 [Caulobacteraceae bacterium]
MRSFAILGLLALAACNPQPASYPLDYERNFTMACEAQGSSNALCSCVWDRIEADISPGDFAALERLPGPEREAHPLTAQINGYVEACNVTLTAPPPAAEEPVPAP